MKTPEEWFEFYVNSSRDYINVSQDIPMINLIIDAQKEAVAETEEFYKKIIHDLKEDSTAYQHGVEDERQRWDIPYPLYPMFGSAPGSYIGNAITALLEIRDKWQKPVRMAFNGVVLTATMDDTKETLADQFAEVTGQPRTVHPRYPGDFSG